MATNNTPPLSLKAPPPQTDFMVGWICVLKKEYHAAVQILDERYDTTGLVRSLGDKNHYILGRVGTHNVMINLPLAEKYGQNHASRIALDMRRTFPKMRFVLLVGIAGGVPSPEHDIRLGDVVLGTRAVPYGFGKQTDHGFERTGLVQVPPRELLEATTFLEERIRLEDVRLSEAIESVRTKSAGGGDAFLRPAKDRLYKGELIHKEPGCDCLLSESRQGANMYLRDDRKGDLIQVFRGGIGSDNRVIKNAQVRDDIATRENILCYEMEATGVMFVVPCLPIRGIADYADGHKNDHWHLYAALAAATCARELLLSLSPQFVAQFPLAVARNVLGQYNTDAVNRNASSSSEVVNLRHTNCDLANHHAALNADKTPSSDFQDAGDEVQRPQVLGQITEQHNTLPLSRDLEVREYIYYIQGKVNQGFD
ncbi:purine and uridine phosphorylase [Aspergillus campestris IBT 28561]|uniref:Purine and uridine phosphorylase n=1 Tax=Aspergillus campestris (strain IBT 28561) TaxID=1392248 RepID=A0A2I1D9V3_ASPC2|nr:purine and uridine phosphorylase [Aspergillus campestris IBT 28561]PKY06641.1 purine and uridine phosphorylase [Aspergillus campestris IBT 28561]